MTDQLPIEQPAGVPGGGAAAAPGGQRSPLQQWRDSLGSVPASLAWVAAALVAWFVMAHTLSKGLPPGIVVSGIVFGSLYALTAIGLVLIYRANRVVNFAQAQFGAVAAVLAIEFHVHWGLPYFASVFGGFVIALVTGAIVNFLVINRFRKASRLILSVVTIGLAEILSGVSILIPVVIGRGKPLATFKTPFQAHFKIYPVLFNGNYVAAVVAVFVVMSGLAAFFRFSDYGVAIRAAAENRDRASLLGIPVPRLNTIVWSLAALLSAVAVILRVPIVGFGSFNDISGGGNALLLRTLAAAVIGRMENLPRTAIAAIALGVFDATATWQTSNTVIVDAMLVVVILVALLLQRGFLSRAMDTGIASFRAMREVRPIPDELRHLPEVRLAQAVITVVVAAVALTLPMWLSSSKTLLSGLILIFAMVAVSLVVLTGWAGHISLGQFALVGFGGATTGILYQQHHVDFLYAVVAGTLVSALVALVIGLPALRIKGPFLAVTTLAFAVTSSTYFLSERFFPWFVPSRMDRPVLFDRIRLDSDVRIYYFCLVGLLFVIAGARSLRRTRAGRALIAVRDNESAAETFMLNATRLKLAAFVLSGAIAGFAGAIYVTHQKGIFTGSFNADASIQLFSMVVIGGLGSLPGAVLGAIYIGITRYLLPAGWSLLASGSGIILLLLFLPEGLGGLLYSTRDRLLRVVAARRHLVVPSLVADLRAAEPEPPPDMLAVAEAVGSSADERVPVGAGAGRGPRR